MDEHTTQLTTGVDESRIYAADGSLVEVIPNAMPRILAGIPLNLRELRVIVDRENFIVNPTNCGILVNSTDLCRSAQRGVANFGGQNGRRSITRPRIQTAFKRCAQVRRKVARKQAKRKAQRRAAARSVARMVN